MPGLSGPPLRGLFAQAPMSPEQSAFLVEAQLNGGMNTFIDPADLPNNQLVLARNVEVDADTIGKSVGSTLLTPTKPNSDRVLLYTLMNRFDGTGEFYRFSKDKLHRRGASSWTEITSLDAYSINDTDRPRVAYINDKMFFAVGNKEIQEVDLAADTYADNGNAPAYKYICGFNNRLVGANLYDASSPNPILIGWSGNLNFDEWNPATDVSAGSNPLIESGSDYMDPITGIFGFAAVMLILRERSLWTATKRPVASAPFQFQAAFPFVGCDTPNSAAQKRNGLIWYDYRTNQVYDYTIGSAPRSVGDAIRRSLSTTISNQSLVQGTFDVVGNRYFLTVPSESTSLTRVYIFDFRTNSWTERTMSDLNGCYALDSAAASVKIDDLVGTINSLTGTINSLNSGASALPPLLYYGRKDGDIYVEGTTDTDNGTTISSEIRSKVFRQPPLSLSISRLNLVWSATRSGSFTIRYSKDAGATWTDYKTITISPADLNKRHRTACVKHVRAKEFQWSITSDSGLWKVLEYSIEHVPVERG